MRLIYDEPHPRTDMLIPKAKKSLGQHFLKNEGVIARIKDLIQTTAEDSIMEIGPGPGALTGTLTSASLRRLILVEIDDYWAEFHAKENASDERIKVLHQDALTFPWEALEGPWKIVGNLPYNIASPLMWDIVLRVPDLSRAVFMVQKEVAERLWARPKTHDYGALSAWVQSFVRVEKGFIVGPGNFTPPPKVDSAVVVFTPHTGRRPFNARALARTLKICFGQRRKQLQAILRSNNFSNAGSILASLGIDATARPETLSPTAFAELAEKLFPTVDIVRQN